MEWPKVKPWRWFAMAGLLAASLACFMAYFTEHPEFAFGVPFLLLAAVGTPFRKGLAWSIGVPSGMVLTIVLFAVVIRLVSSLF